MRSWSSSNAGSARGTMRTPAPVRSVRNRVSFDAPRRAHMTEPVLRHAPRPLGTELPAEGVGLSMAVRLRDTAGDDHQFDRAASVFQAFSIVRTTPAWLPSSRHIIERVCEERAAADPGQFWSEEVTADMAASARATRRAAVAGGSGGSP
jgi:hypothetical protein